jgi:hypothetical protein
MPFARRGTRRMIPTLICVALSLATAARAQKAVSEKVPAAPPAGAISGRVVSQGGETMNGAMAYANSIGTLSLPRSTVADSSGSFKFEGLDAGVYSITASLPGFVSAPAISPAEPRRFYHTGDSVTLTMIKGGVITGTVTSATNGPVVAAPVRVFRVKDLNGEPEPGVVQMRERQTDDRGIYRFYGLPPGTYLISAGGQARIYNGPFAGAYDNDVPTYAPSSSRDTATEFVVHSGEEITADIQYHGEAGQIISGTLAGLAQSASQSMGNATASINLTEVRSHLVVMTVGSSLGTNNTFAFYGVPDGEYELLAQQYLPSRDFMMSEPRRVRVQGTDITGINLNLAPLASISGRVVFESNPPADCVKHRENALPEILINARRFTPQTKPATGKAAKSEPAAMLPLMAANQGADSILDAKGDFVLRNLHRGAYHLDSQLPGTGWYLRSIASGPTTGRPTDPNIPRDGLTVRSGEKVSGLTVTVSGGAAGLRGHITAAEGQRAPAGLRVYLVPAERDNADNVLRFFEGTSDANANFAIDNIAPGRYWLIARVSDDRDPVKVKPIRQEAALRAKVLREAEALKKEISFRPCEQVADYELSWTPAPRQ